MGAVVGRSSLVVGKNKKRRSSAFGLIGEQFQFTGRKIWGFTACVYGEAYGLCSCSCQRPTTNDQRQLFSDSPSPLPPAPLQILYCPSSARRDQSPAPGCHT